MINNGFYKRPKYNWYARTRDEPTHLPATREVSFPDNAVEIDEFPMYRITPQGDIYNSRGQKLAPSTDTKGYLKISFYKDNQRYTRRVHVLVAQQFLPIPEELKDTGNLVVDHIDQDRTHCAVDNLQWVSQAENIRKAYEQGRVQTTSVPVRCIEDDKEFFSCTQAAKHYHISKITVKQAIEERNGYVKRIDKTFEYI